MVVLPKVCLMANSADLPVSDQTCIGVGLTMFQSSLVMPCWLRLTIKEQDVAICVPVRRDKRCMPSQLQKRSLKD